MADALWLIGAFAVCGLLLWLSSRIEPHWSTKDGRRFLTTAQPLDADGRPSGRRHEVRVAVNDDDTLRVGRRRMLGQKQADWRMLGKSPHPPKRREIYLIAPVDATERSDMLALRVPAKSKVVPVLDGLQPGAAARSSVSEFDVIDVDDSRDER